MLSGQMGNCTPSITNGFSYSEKDGSQLRLQHTQAFWPRLITLIAIVLLVYPLVACGSDNVLEDVHASAAQLTLNENGKLGPLSLSYDLARDAHISIAFFDQGGQRYVLRDNEPRTAGKYTAQFDGTYSPDPAKPDRRVLPSGQYRYVLTATAAGQSQESQGDLSIQAPQTLPPSIDKLVAVPEVISPNGDAVDDQTKISYTLTQDSTVSVFVENAAGNKYFLQPATARKAAAYGLEWNGKIGNDLMPDGTYNLHVQAQDNIGNVTDQSHRVTLQNGGKSELQITKVEFSPIAVPLGGDLHVTIKVKNTGTTTIQTFGPPPGTAYTTNMTYNNWLEDDGATPRYYERPGLWRVAVSWNVAGSPYPVRWGLTPDMSPLAPGQESTITGTIKLLPRTPEVRFWASVEQGGVGFPGGEVAQTVIRIGY